MIKHIVTVFAAVSFLALVSAHGDQTEQTLLAKDAAIKGEVQYFTQGDYIYGWAGVGSSTSWKLNGFEAGNYDVTIVYSLQGERAKRQFNISCGSDTKKITSLMPTGGWNTFKSKSLGSIKISKSDTIFSVTAVEIPPTGYLMNLQKVTFKKAL